MSDLAERVAAVEREVGGHVGDTDYIYLELKKHRRILREHSRILNEHSRDLSWLKSAMGSVMGHFDIEPPPEVPDGEEE